MLLSRISPLSRLAWRRASVQSVRFIYQPHPVLTFGTVWIEKIEFPLDPDTLITDIQWYQHRGQTASFKTHKSNHLLVLKKGEINDINQSWMTKTVKNWCTFEADNFELHHLCPLCLTIQPDAVESISAVCATAMLHILFHQASQKGKDLRWWRLTDRRKEPKKSTSSEWDIFPPPHL